MAWIICYRCGYDLTGLELPRRCPECGRSCDPENESKAAELWYRKWWSPIALLVPKRIPEGLWFVVDDGPLQRLARRRIFYWVWLPVILNIVLVFCGHFIEVHHDGHVDRLYALNLHFFPAFGGGWNPPWRLSMPTELDTFMLSMALASLVLTILVWMIPNRLILFTLRRRKHLSGAGRFQLSLVGQLLGLICWFWFLTMVQSGIADLFNWKIRHVLDGAEYAFLGLWLAIGLVAYPRLILAEKSGALFGSRWWLAGVVAFISIGGPFAAYVAMN